MNYFPQTFFRLLGLLTLLTAGSLLAQNTPNVEKVDPGPFYGFWKFQEPAGDTCIVIIKRGGRLSCFWAGTATKSIEKGTWSRLGESMTAVWEAGHTDVYKMLGDNAIERSTFYQGKSLLGDPSLTIRGVRIDSRIPGSLTVQGEGPPPIREEIVDESTRPNIPVNSPLVGYWKIDQSAGIFGIGGGEPQFYLQLSRNGDALVALREWEGDQGVRGIWSIDGDRAIITWPNNRRDVLFPKDNGEMAFGYYKQRDELTRQPRSVTTADKVDAQEASKYFEAGNFKRLTVVDIRGKWMPRDSDGKREYISIEGWGNAYRYPAKVSVDGTDPGKWRLESDRIHITWIDGTKDAIRLDVSSFVQDSFSADQDFSGTPYRTIEVMRVQTEEDSPLLP